MKRAPAGDNAELIELGNVTAAELHAARGTFAVAGNVAGFYPMDTPGGWNLLGRTDAELQHANALQAHI